MTRRNKRMLLFSYFYPPLGGPGVQRPCKMTFYLQKHGWHIDVVSVKGIIYHSRDKKLSSECGERNNYSISSLDVMSILSMIFRASKKVEEKIYFSTPEKLKKIVRGIFPVDDKIGWLPLAVKAGSKLCKLNDYDTVMATIGPYTSAVTSYLVAKLNKLPLVVDYRDPWVLHPYLNFITPLHRKIAVYLENKILKSATAITTSSKKNKQNLLAKYGAELDDKISVMYNAWDESDFTNIKSKTNKGKVVFSYVGGFYGNQTPSFFIRALEELDAQNRLPEDIEIRFIGNLFSEIEQILFQSKISRMVKHIPQIPHQQAIEFMSSAHVLLLFISSLKSEGVVAGKIFEYIRSRKEILAMVPVNGETADILREYDYKFISDMENIEQIKENFLDLYQLAKMEKLAKPEVNDKYSRRRQVYNFEKFLKQRLNTKQ